MALSRRRFLRNLSMSGAAIRVGLPPLAAMFNGNGTAYAAGSIAPGASQAIQSKFVFWFNGNGIPERYWIPTEIGTGYELTPCLAPLASVRDDIHVISGIDNPNARVTAPGNTHHKSMSALVSGTPYTGRGAGGASIDQVIAGAMGGESRFRSLQVGVCQESHGENIHRNLAWAGCRGVATRVCDITTTRIRMRSRPRVSAPCATSAAGTWRNSPTCWEK